MEFDHLMDAIRARLGTHLHRPGWISYSPLGVLKQKQHGVLVMGLNPAVDDSNCPLAEQKCEPNSQWSAFTHVCWRRHKKQPCGPHHFNTNGRVKPTLMQREVSGLAGALGIEINALFGTNAIFVATHGIAELKKLGVDQLWKACWPIHRDFFLSEMKPKLIITLGNGPVSAFSLLESEARIEKSDQRKGNRCFRWRYFVGDFEMQNGHRLRTTVVGLPHPSRAAIFGSLAYNYRDWLSTC